MGLRAQDFLGDTPYRDPSGAAVGAVASWYDITALREQEADLRSFAAVAAHDLKSPLAAVAGYAELLAEPEAPPFPAARIRAGVERMRRLIDDLLTYATARDAALQPVPIDLRAVVDETVSRHLEHAAARPDAVTPAVFVGPLPAVHADPVLLRQLLQNLIGNAVKYTPPGQTPRLDITASTGDGHVCLTIADRGIGIPEGQHRAIFESFHRAHRDSPFPGTGLGLAICQRIATRHGGAITATDNPGGGARFHITLPTPPATTTPTQPTGRSRVH
ncbi:ATP-binding protein [Dactylosporangium sucinum]|uniref:Sensor-like histidine kinase SenX3 n=1 Tax=Dactylosporangium sucinum TaxID=1424081 RepID=A0A917UF16_9ACTN|nr:HAMP domain-containing sensor histidine kinase [Dactylosporangium sucinum]GGM81115.1 hypothetical protein GCM10007977_098110 [Dactylosporangium sucinum]